MSIVCSYSLPSPPRALWFYFVVGPGVNERQFLVVDVVYFVYSSIPLLLVGSGCSSHTNTINIRPPVLTEPILGVSTAGGYRKRVAHLMAKA